MQPLCVVFVRHGESENNVLQHQLSREGSGRNYGKLRASDPRLTDKGKVQADLIGKRIATDAKHRVVAVWSSYLSRAVHTCLRISAQLGAHVPVHVKPGIAELGGMYSFVRVGATTDRIEDTQGVFQTAKGMTNAEVLQVMPHATVDHRCDEGWYHSDSVESSHEGLQRAEALKAGIEQFASTPDLVTSPSEGAPSLRTLVIVTHGDFFNVFLDLLRKYSCTGLEHFTVNSSEKVVVPNSSITSFHVTPVHHERHAPPVCHWSLATISDTSHLTPEAASLESS